MTTILQGIGWFLLKIYELFENIGLPGAYALALVVFTILIKIILFPLSYKGKKSMMKMNSLQAKMKQLEVQYGKDRERYQEKVQELYAKEKVNPMGGCLWSFIPLFILIPLYSIIRQPMVYMLGLSKEAVDLAVTAAQNAGAVFTGNAAYYEIQLAGMLGDQGIFNAVAAAVPEYASKLQVINFDLFGIDLGSVPQLTFWKTFETLGVWCSIGLFLIPLVVTAFNFLYTKYSQKTNSALTAPAEEGKKKKKKDDGKPEPKSQAERSSQMMMWMMPIMYLWFGYSMPAGMCVYMLANALFTMIQDKVCVVMMKPGYERMLAEQKARDEREKEEIAARKAAIAERRRREEEENKANKGKKKGKKPVKKAAPANKNGRIGIRTYALGRDYDPDRYGGVTPYRDPQDIIDEQAIEDARQSKRQRKAEAVEKAIARAEEDGDIDRLQALEEEAAALEAEADAVAEDEETAALPAAEDAASDEDASEEV